MNLVHHFIDSSQQLDEAVTNIILTCTDEKVESQESNFMLKFPVPHSK